MAETHLKPRQYYIDLYDRHTVEQCRLREKVWSQVEADPPPKKAKVTKEQAERVRNWVVELSLRHMAGERYLSKEKTIREWMERDEHKDNLLASVEAPEGIRCLTCRNLVKPTWKDLWSGGGGRQTRASALHV